MARSLKEYLELGYNTYLLSLATVFMGVATITIVTTGIVTLTHFNDDECTVWSFDGGDMTKNNVEEKVDEIVYIFIAGLLATGIYGAFVMRQKNQNDTTVMKFFGMGSSFIFGFVGALLITVAIYMIQMGVLTASCTVTSTGSAADYTNGKVHMLPMYAAFALVFLLSSAIRHLGSTTVRAGLLRSSEKTRDVGPVNRNLVDLLGVVVASGVRLAFAWWAYSLFHQSNADFGEKYTVTPTSQCVEAISSSSLPASTQRMFENVEVGSVVDGGWVTNKHWARMTLAAGILATLEAFLVLDQMAVTTGSMSVTVASKVMDYFGYQAMAADGLGRVIAFTTDILLSVLIYVFIMHHEVAACSVLDPSHEDIRNLYAIATVFYVRIFVSWYAMREYIRYIEHKATGKSTGNEEEDAAVSLTSEGTTARMTYTRPPDDDE
jgi:hypothetical protein